MEGMEPDDLLCSRNARPEKDGEGNLVILLLTERAHSEGARSTRAFEDRPGYPWNKIGIERTRAVEDQSASSLIFSSRFKIAPSI